MATKSKNTNLGIKVLLFFLAAIFISLTVVQMQFLVLYSNPNLETLVVADYRESETFENGELYSAFRDLTSLFVKQTGELQEEPETIIFGEEEDGISLADREYFYLIERDGDLYTNTTYSTAEDFLKNNPFSYSLKEGSWQAGTEAKASRFMNYFRIEQMAAEDAGYLAFGDAFFEQRQKEWEAEKERVFPMVARLLAFFIAALLFVIWSCVVTGKRNESGALEVGFLDRIYTDFQVVILGLAITLWLAAASAMSYHHSYIQGAGLSLDQVMNMVGMGALTFGISCISGLILLSLIRKIKRRRFFRNSLIFQIFFRIDDFFKSIFDGRRFAEYPLTKNLFQRQLAFIALSATLMFFCFLALMAGSAFFFLLCLALEIVLLYRFARGNKVTFAEINKGFSASIAEQMKAERMKIDLVTNVSHDLKTPLTSIISYVELLSKEELEETARDYVKILAEKSERLKQIVADLFDLAKSTSGNLQIEAELLDLKTLLEQTLADMSAELEKTDLQIKTKYPAEEVPIFSDGKKLYRVFQNLLDNALKYSLPGTRVFLELEQDESSVRAEIKNISAYEMDFSPEEVMQRFNRGDKARETEGTGLGLSIAESFTRSCGGSFELKIDGDYFKVILSFPRASEEQIKEAKKEKENKVDLQKEE